jgi:hypothetical protein
MWSDAITLTTPGPDISFNTGTDVYFLDPARCNWAPDLRVTSDPAPRTTGAIIFPILKGAGHITLGGLLVPGDNLASTRDAMAASLRSACDAILAADGTIAHPSRGSLTVRCEVYPGFAGAYVKEFVFTLITAAPGSW